MDNSFQEINKLKQKQMLKIVSSSFYKELVKYGVDNSDIVSVSMNLLDYATDTNGNNLQSKNGYFPFKINDINDSWQQKKELGILDVTIKPMQKKEIDTIVEWLSSEEIRNTFIGLFPKTKKELESYFLKSKDKEYFSIYYKRSSFVGFIGAERKDDISKKLEMKKLVGDSNFRGKGIGKSATFLFLYHIFNNYNFNKVFIHSMDTNIKNINLNSKFGFSLEGFLFKEMQINDVYHDVIRMGLLKEKWFEIYNGVK
ncbi:MAG: GNAT family N-acetyltransferase [Calditrichae bacterium]|nr:GNAT family N-acetyltransferase [Calditrichia bacterium]